MDQNGEGSALADFLRCLSDAWPEHRGFIRRRFGESYSHLAETSEHLATKLQLIAGTEIRRYCDDYRWVCEILQAEELHFRRSGQYRLSRFAEAQHEVYDNPAFMERYVRGLLVTQLMWANQTGAYDIYLRRFLSGNRAAYRHLEIGPGHGLLLSEALSDPRCIEAAAWDISSSSLKATAHCLSRLGVHRVPSIERRDFLSPGIHRNDFDSVVISEVLEHLEQPDRALSAVSNLLAPLGRAFINVPINSPAPDHIYLFRAPAEVNEAVAAAGLKIESVDLLPLTGYTLDQAMRESLTISCAIIGTKE